jgi:lipopolysaccharide/colanic/teichoic acid biosynthesis glycosyltransferase
VKRTFDVAAAICALVVLSPLFAILAAAVWLSDPGPVIYRGQRIGLYGRPFAVLKFRSMRLQAAGRSEITVRHDPRVTPVGRFLRAAKLDELPQLVNVLRGEMSLVGPRPEAPMYVALYTEQQWNVLRVRPGITGLAQVNFRQEEELLSGEDPDHFYRTVLLPAKLALDLKYVDHHTFMGDLRIILMTLGALVRPASTPLLVAPSPPPPPAQSVQKIGVYASVEKRHE